MLNKKFIEVKNKSTYPPSKDNPKVEVHEQRGFISYDKARKTYLLRQFHMRDLLVNISSNRFPRMERRFVFVSENIENIPGGCRAKGTYHLVIDKEFSETFELVEPGKEFEVYSKAMLVR